MTTSIFGSSDFSGSATIYTFPPRGRFAVNAQHDEAKLPPGVKIAWGSSWYHDAAIQDAIKAEQGRKN